MGRVCCGMALVWAEVGGCGDIVGSYTSLLSYPTSFSLGTDVPTYRHAPPPPPTPNSPSTTEVTPYDKEPNLYDAGGLRGNERKGGGGGSD